VTPSILERSTRVPEIGEKRSCVTSRAGLNVGSPAITSARVLINQLSKTYTVEHAPLSIGVPGQVRDHMAAGPLGEQGRAEHGLVGEIAQAIENPKVRVARTPEKLVQLCGAPRSHEGISHVREYVLLTWRQQQ
jgi:hypothetical protein